MSLETIVRTKVLTSAAAVAALSGGIYASGSLKPGGLNRDNYPRAFQTNPPYLRLPVLMITAREAQMDRTLADQAAQVHGTRQIVECEYLSDADSGYTAITTARDAVRLLLDERRVAGAGLGRLVNRIEYKRDPDLDNACFHRDDYQYIGVLSS